MSRDASAKLFLHQRRPGGREGEAAAITRRAGEPDAANDWMLPAPTQGDTGALAARRDRAAAIGMLAHLAAITVVAATTIGVFFGIAFVLLQPMAKPTVGQRPLGEPGAVAAMPQSDLPGRGTAAKAGPAAAVLAEPVPALRPVGGSASAPPIAKFAGPAPKAAVAGASPTGETEAKTRAAARSPADQAAGLLTRGDAFMRAGDIASARLFYERAADGGDGQAALRAGATFDPVFLASIGLRMRGDPARALDWYRRALALGASSAEPYLHRLESK